MTLAELLVKLRLDNTSFATGVTQSKSMFSELTSGLENSVRGLGDAWEANIGKMATVGAGLTAAITVPFAAIAQSAYQLGTQMKTAEIGFTTMLGSAEAAQELLAQLKDFAETTPFEFTDLVRAAQRMLALGFNAQEVVPILRAAGDAAAAMGGGAETIDRITRALGQMGTRGKVAAGEMLQLTEVGIGAWRMLAEGMGVSIEEAQARVSKGMVSAAEGIPLLVQGIQAQFNGMMDEMSGTAAGKLSNVIDKIQFSLAEIGRVILPVAADILDNFINPLVDGIAWLAEKFGDLPQPVQIFIVGMAGIAAAIGPLLLAFAGIGQALAMIAPLIGATGVGGALVALLPVLGYVAAAVAAVAAAWGLWRLEPVQDAVRAVWDTIKGFWNETLVPFLEVVGRVHLAILSWGAGIAQSGLTTVWGVISAGIDALKAAAVAVWENALVPLWNVFVSIYESLKPILAPLADLGIALAYVQALAVVAYFQALWEVLKVLWDVLVGVVDLALWPFREMLSAIVTLTAGPVKAAMEGLSWVFNNAIKPAIDLVIKGIGEFLDWLRRIPGVAAVIDTAKQKFSDLGDKLADVGAKSADAEGKQAAAAKAIGEAGVEAGKASTEQSKLAVETGRVSAAVTTATGAHNRSKTAMKGAKDEAALLKQAYATLGLEDVRGKADRLAEAINTLKQSGEWNRLSLDDQKRATDALERAMYKASGETLKWQGYLEAITSKTSAARTETEAWRLVWERLDVALANAHGELLNLPPVLQAINDAAIAQQTELMAAASRVYELEDAFKTLGIAAKADLDKVAADAAKARDAVLGSDETTDFEKRTAVYKALKAQVEAAQAAGIAVPEEQRKLLAQMEGDLSEHLPKVSQGWSNFASGVSTMITNLAQTLNDALWDGDTSWGQKGMELLKGLGKAVTGAFIEPAMAAIAKFVVDSLEGVLKGAIDAAIGWFGGLGKAAGSALGGVGVGDVPGVGAGVPGLGGGGGTAPPVPGAGGAVGGALGAIGAIGSAVGAVSGVIGNFQMAGMNKSLDIIVLHTLQTANQLIYGIQPQINEHLPGISGLNDYMWEVMTPTLTAMLTETETLKTDVGTIKGITGWIAAWELGDKITAMSDAIANTLGGTIEVNVYVDKAGASAEEIGEATAKALGEALRLQGVG